TSKSFDYLHFEHPYVYPVFNSNGELIDIVDTPHVDIKSHGEGAAVLEIPVLPGVYPPLHSSSKISAKATEKYAKNGMRVLIMGTGVGLEAYIAAAQGARVDAVDLKELASENTKLTCSLGGVEKNVNTLVKKDLFNNLGQYDLIVFNVPHVREIPTPFSKDITPGDKNVEDFGAEILTTVAATIASHIAIDGKAILVNADSENVENYLRERTKLHVSSSSFGFNEEESRAYIISREKTAGAIKKEPSADELTAADSPFHKAFVTLFEKLKDKFVTPREAELNEAEREEMNKLCADLVEAHARQVGDPRYFDSTVLPEFLEEVKGVTPTLEAFRICKDLIDDYRENVKKKYFYYMTAAIPALLDAVKKTKTPIETLKACKALIDDYREKAGDPYDYVKHVLPILLGKVEDFTELEDWDRICKGLIGTYMSHLGDPRPFIQENLLVLLDEAANRRELEASAAFVEHHLENVGNPDYYSRSPVSAPSAVPEKSLKDILQEIGSVPFIEDFDELFEVVDESLGGRTFAVERYKYIGPDKALSEGVELKNGNYYVVKDVPEGLKHDPNDRTFEIFFLPQAKMLAAINPANTNPYLPKLMGTVIVEDPRPFMSKKALMFEFIDGKNLENYAKDLYSRPAYVQESIFLDLATRILKGYKQTYLHNGYVHGDIDPSGIMITEDKGKIKRVASVDNDTMTPVGKEGVISLNRRIAFKEKYSSEDRETRKEDDETPIKELCLPRDDVYSLCVTLLVSIEWMLKAAPDKKKKQPRGKIKRLQKVLRKYRELSATNKADKALIYGPINELIKEVEEIESAREELAPAVPPKHLNVKSTSGTQTATKKFNRIKPLTLKRKKGEEKFNFVPRKSEFTIMRVEDNESKKDSRSVAYLVTYPDKNGNTCLRYGIRDVKGIVVPEAFTATLKRLKIRCQGRVLKDKKFNRRSFEQAHVMWAGAIFQKELHSHPRETLLAFINTKKELGKYGEVTGRNLQNALTTLGYQVFYISSRYKLYQHYFEKGLDLPKRFEELSKMKRNKKNPLKVFMELFNEAQGKDGTFKLLTDRNLQGVLARFGYPVQFISNYSKLYRHYLEKGIDLPGRFEGLSNMKRYKEKPLKVFMELLDEAKGEDGNFKLLTDTNLQGVLTGFGYSVDYINSCYRIYTYWAGKLDADKVFGFSEYSRDEFQRVLREVEKIGLPQGEGEYSLPVEFYLYKILNALGKVPKNKRSPLSLKVIPGILAGFMEQRIEGPLSPGDITGIKEAISLVRGSVGKDLTAEAVQLFLKKNFTAEDEEELSSVILNIKKAIRKGKQQIPDGYIQQGEKSMAEFELLLDSGAIGKNNITAAQKDRISRVIRRLRGALKRRGLSRKEKEKLWTRIEELKDGTMQIYGFKPIIKGHDDFFLGQYNAHSNKLFLDTDLIGELERRGLSTLADEYLLHEVLCPVLGHYSAIRMQQKLFPRHYPRKWKLKSQIFLTLYKGLLGEALRERIDDQSPKIAATGQVQHAGDQKNDWVNALSIILRYSERGEIGEELTVAKYRKLFPPWIRPTESRTRSVFRELAKLGYLTAHDGDKRYTLTLKAVYFAELKPYIDTGNIERIEALLLNPIKSRADLARNVVLDILNSNWKNTSAGRWWFVKLLKLCVEYFSEKKGSPQPMNAILRVIAGINWLTQEAVNLAFKENLHRDEVQEYLKTIEGLTSHWTAEENRPDITEEGEVSGPAQIYDLLSNNASFINLHFEGERERVAELVEMERAKGDSAKQEKLLMFYLNMIYLLVDQGRPKEAEEYYKEAVRTGLKCPGKLEEIKEIHKKLYYEAKRNKHEGLFQAISFTQRAAGIRLLHVLLADISSGEKDPSRARGYLKTIKHSIPMPHHPRHAGIKHFIERKRAEIEERLPVGIEKEALKHDAKTGHICSRKGKASEKEFMSKVDSITSVKENDITDRYRFMMIVLLERALQELRLPRKGLRKKIGGLRKRIREIEDQVEMLKNGATRIYRFNGIIKGREDFFLGHNRSGRNSAEGSKIFLAVDLMEKLQERGPPDLVKEYLLHEMLCPILKHERAIFVQQRLFPEHYQSEPEMRKQRLATPYKGLLGKILREIIDNKDLEKNLFVKINYCIDRANTEQVDAYLSDPNRADLARKFILDILDKKKTNPKNCLWWFKELLRLSKRYFVEGEEKAFTATLSIIDNIDWITRDTARVAFFGLGENAPTDEKEEGEQELQPTEEIINTLFSSLGSGSTIRALNPLEEAYMVSLSRFSERDELLQLLTLANMPFVANRGSEHSGESIKPTISILKSLEERIKKDPKREAELPIIYLNMVYLLAHQGRMDEAKEYYSLAAEIGAKNPEEMKKVKYECEELDDEAGPDLRGLHPATQIHLAMEKAKREKAEGENKHRRNTEKVLTDVWSHLFHMLLADISLRGKDPARSGDYMNAFRQDMPVPEGLEGFIEEKKEEFRENMRRVRKTGEDDTASAGQNEDGHICQGEKAFKRMAENIKLGDLNVVTDQTQVRSDIENIEQKIDQKLKDAVRSDSPLRIIATDAVVASTNDFALGFYSHAPPVKEKLIAILGSEEEFNRVFPVPTIVISREILNSPEASIRQECIYHEAVCHTAGHYKAIEKQQKIFELENYTSGEYEEKDGVKYSKDQPKKIFKGQLGRVLREIIDTRTTGLAQGEATEAAKASKPAPAKKVSTAYSFSEKSWEKFKAQYEGIKQKKKNDITPDYKDRLIKLLTKRLKEKSFSNKERQQQLEEQLKNLKEYKIYGFDSIVEAPNDFVLKWNNLEKKELFLATDVIDELKRGPPEVVDEYLLYALLRRGRVGKPLRQIINWKITSITQAEVSELDAALAAHNEAWKKNKYLKLTKEQMRHLIKQKVVYLLKVKGIDSPVRGVLLTHPLKTGGELGELQKRPLWNNMIEGNLEGGRYDTILFWAIGAVKDKSTQKVNLGGIFANKAKKYFEKDFSHIGTYSPIVDFKKFDKFRKELREKGISEDIIQKHGIYLYLVSLKGDGYELYLKHIVEEGFVIPEKFFKEWKKKWRDPVENFHSGRNGASIATVLPFKEGFTRPDAPYTIVYGYKGFRNQVKEFTKLRQLSCPHDDMAHIGTPDTYFLQAVPDMLKLRLSLKESVQKTETIRILRGRYANGPGENDKFKYLKKLKKVGKIKIIDRHAGTGKSSKKAAPLPIWNIRVVLIDKKEEDVYRLAEFKTEEYYKEAVRTGLKCPGKL
ncbi:hypothetical protein ACFL5C_01670, partial [Candidatus Omnitrophota bacterium]